MEWGLTVARQSLAIQQRTISSWDCAGPLGGAQLPCGLLAWLGS